MIRVIRDFNNAVVPGGHWTGNKFYRNHAAGASVIDFPHVFIGQRENSETHQIENVYARRICMYFRGVAEDHISKIGIYTFNPLDQSVFDGYTWDYKRKVPVLEPTGVTTDYDSYATTAPSVATLKVNGTDTVFLYYRGKQDADDDSPNMKVAISTDAIHFTRQPNNKLTFKDKDNHRHWRSAWKVLSLGLCTERS